MIHVLIEENYQNNNRVGRVLDAIFDITRKKRIAVRIYKRIEELGNVRVVILIYASLKWATDTVESLGKRGIHPLLFGFYTLGLKYPYSHITLNYTKSSYLLAKYLLERRHAPLAFLGYNKDSMPDMLKLEGVRAATEEEGVPCVVIPNAGDILQCFREFKAQIEDCGNVICSNDSIAMFLRSTDPELVEKSQLASCTGTLLGEYLPVPHPTTRIDYYKAGKNLAELYLFLEKQEIINPTCMTLEMDLVIPSGEQPAAGEARKPSAGTVDFYGDPNIRAVENLERMILKCDELDIAILKWITQGKSYEQIAELENLAVNTVKYRVHAMLKNAGLVSKKQLLDSVSCFGLAFP